MFLNKGYTLVTDDIKFSFSYDEERQVHGVPVYRIRNVTCWHNVLANANYVLVHASIKDARRWLQDCTVTNLGPLLRDLDKQEA